jgi:hypothetical protein
MPKQPPLSDDGRVEGSRRDHDILTGQFDRHESLLLGVDLLRRPYQKSPIPS